MGRRERRHRPAVCHVYQAQQAVGYRSCRHRTVGVEARTDRAL